MAGFVEPRGYYPWHLQPAGTVEEAARVLRELDQDPEDAEDAAGEEPLLPCPQGASEAGL